MYEVQTNQRPIHVETSIDINKQVQGAGERRGGGGGGQHSPKTAQPN